MNTISYLLLTEVKAKNLSKSEKIANDFLRPAQYLWNGKKVDFIQEGDQKAVQLDFIYQPHERSWKKTAFMVIALIPSTLIGAAFKAYALFKHHNREEDAFIRKCLKKGTIGTVGTVFTTENQAEFGKKIKNFIKTLRSTHYWNPHIDKDPNKPLFLSEIDSMRLLYEEHFLSHKSWIERPNPQAAATNRQILDNIHLLWNVSDMNLADHYVKSQPGKELAALREMNPSVIAVQTGEGKPIYSRPVEARDFFSAKK